MPSSAVDQPIINDPYHEPTKYWEFSEGYPEKKPGRRPAGYYLATRSESVKGPVAAEAFRELPVVNRIRSRVKKWRESNYPAVSRTTRILLDYWNYENRLEQNRKRLFFCQLEAAETIIWLTEASDAEKQGIEIPSDTPVDGESETKGYAALRRYCCKMATGSGKTIVMAMLIAWCALNKIQNKQDKRFSDTVFVVAPNLTVRERLRVLLPSDPNNYYEQFDLVPRPLLSLLSQTKIDIVNWQALSEDIDPKRGVVKRGKESETAFAKRVLKNLGDKQNVLVINDEAHHAYRPALRELGSKQETLVSDDESEISPSERKEREEEAEEATVWVNALDKINFARKINFCLDMSATPFYIKGSGHGEGEPLPWLVTDFGLVDAIESGIVKIPRIPVDDNSGQPIPKYFRLWKEIMSKLPGPEREAPHRKAKPESVMREAEGALATLASQWEKTFKEFRDKKYPVPPAMIVVCANTDLAKLMFDEISRGKVMPELENSEKHPNNTLHIDSRQLEEAEKQVEPSKEMSSSERLREMVATVGKVGELGEKIRCVVSVSMLNEGWDAQNVTQILGLRAFGSQLLCEQVVGRGLRRTNYDDLSVPEYV
ncbi:MAG: DEAD/DEAH box helicase, partial [Nitrososphaerales archaeon]